jgi:S1-C subfamily serine protease
MNALKQRTAASNLIAGVLGGLVVLVVGSILIATDVIDTGDTTQRVVRQSPLSQPAADPGAAADGKTVQDIYREEGRGVVFIQAEGVTADQSLFGGSQEGTATGSGFVVDSDGTIVTNAHVVEGAEKVRVSFDNEGGKTVDAEVKGVDDDSDLAVLQVDPEAVDLTVLPLGDLDGVEVGDPVVAIGNPFGLQRTVTTGIVSALQRQVDAPSGFPISDVIQTDASINPGNSGGPLLDAQGKVIGINSQIATGGGQGSVGIGFAVPVDTLKTLLPSLRAGEEIRRAYLGVVMGPADGGARVQEITPDSPADDAGLRAGNAGDVIVSVDGEQVTGPDDVVAAVAGKQPGDTIEVEYLRGDDRRTASIKLAERPEELGSSSGQQAPEDEGLPFDLP